jgi:hypothetical protein
MAKRASRCACRFLFVASIAAANVLAFPASAYERVLRPFTYPAIPHLHQKADFFGGIDLANAVTFAWAGATYAPAGTLIEDGWRIRFMGGAGRYTYRTPIVPGGINDASVYTAELLGGYRKTFDNIFGQRVYAGAFVGVNYEDQVLAMPDPFNPTQGNEAGVKASLELYSRIAQHTILTAMASASTAHNKYYVKAALFYELNALWSIGGELATMGDARYSENRAGLAASLTWRGKILTLSAGTLDNTGKGSGAYTTLSVYSPF